MRRCAVWKPTPPAPERRTTSHHRNGQSLVLMFFILVALIGVMALTLDFGFVLLARRQMQTGVNTAAKEGLRGEGLTAYDTNNEQLRRTNARDLLRLTYDDDFDLSANNTTLGAGIDTSLIQGNGFRSTTIGPANTTLEQDLANRSSFIYRPDGFELNQTNEDHGDMLVGNYDPTLTHSEAADYTRLDFDPTGSGAFLVRMRRTHDPDGLDEVADVSSRGGGLPLLLARLGWMRAEDAAAAYSIRRDGVIVRATAIADGVPARAVGVADLTLSPAITGAAPIAIELSGWQAMSVGTSYTLDTDNGQLAEAAMSPVTTSRVIDATSPLFVSQVLQSVEQSWPSANVIGDGVDQTFYVSIYESLTSTTGSVTEELLVGFARLQMARSGAVITVTRLSQIVAAENASSLPAVGWQSNLDTQLQTHNGTYAALSSSNQTAAMGELIETAFDQSRSIATNDAGLLAPALVRAVP